MFPNYIVECFIVSGFILNIRAQYLTSELAGRTVPIEVSQDETVNAEDTKQCVKCSGIILSHKDKLILMNGKMLTDMHHNSC